jgi:hypothetical protein
METSGPAGLDVEGAVVEDVLTLAIWRVCFPAPRPFRFRGSLLAASLLAQQRLSD